ncbi:DUF4956 domain-containing protein [Anaerotignum sp. MB30-C6]|uniref:DUF4956 domain-containing protein n=1 Tax=Anaerotignum sp. MB30-C6 TaxID=3070814 RepID=UPI0027DB2849|nr:DUF4956 domain-containing protein [Anaerotignum sp. MB30-C6]WMI82628.1 DUF4956 domain-containing protein [Anaerotignum sp. MB30-C6]
MNKYLYDIISNTGSLSVEDIILRIIFSVVMGCIIFLSYRMTHTGTIYSHKFNITLLTLTVLTTTVMTVIGNNIALSLGMVGALSIIRFRTSIKDSRDTVYIFWTIIVGICSGVGDYTVATVGSIAVFVVLLLFGRVKSNNRILLIVKGSRLLEEEIRRTIFTYFPKPPVLKVQNSSAEKVEMIFELNKKLLDSAQKKEMNRALGEKRDSKTILDLLYHLGDVDYVNIVVQSDEIS